MLDRILLPDLRKILLNWKKMVFVSGPRQVGKTTLSEQVRGGFSQGNYFNWDIATDQRKLARDPYFFEKEPRNEGEPFLLVFDEIHKYRRWKNYLKGIYDRYRNEYHVLVTGSGRLDLYQKGGDSLLGRYVGVPLFPLTVGELSGRRPTWSHFQESLKNPSDAVRSSDIFDALFRYSGFPEPYLRGEDDFYRSWSDEREKRLVREDIRDATAIRNLSLIEVLIKLLEPRIGSPLSINSLREDLGVAFETVRDWLDVLEDFYYFFRIPPYSRKLARSFKKESKLYFYDWCHIADPAFRFENLAALHLLKAVSLWRAFGEAKVELFYLRDKEKREVDFLIINDGKPAVLLECKLSDKGLSPHLLYYQERLQVPVAVQLIFEKGYLRQWRENKRTQWVTSADRWLGLLP